MKTLIQRLLQKILGFRTYLFIFSLYIIYTLHWNRKEGDFLRFIELLPSEGILLDIGANIGVMSYHLSVRRPHSQIIAIEPLPQNSDNIKRVINFFRLTNVKLLELGLSDKPGQLEMVMPVMGHVKKQGLAHVVHESITDFNDGDRYSVEVTTLDSLPELQNENRLTGIKIDVENWEYFVLKGGIQILTKHKPVVYAELWDNENRTLCFNLMEKLGYDIQVNIGGRLQSFNIEEHKAQNFFFIPRV
ncbi:MAG: FkbM family methyltransferase [Bacteroidales bacterium]|nr:FkbM family methyltransferase [Bacteroidales bacterium]